MIGPRLGVKRLYRAGTSTPEVATPDYSIQCEYSSWVLPRKPKKPVKTHQKHWAPKTLQRAAMPQ